MTSAAATDPGDATTVAPEAPVLSLEHVKKELELLHRGAHRTRRSAIYARLSEAAGEGTTLSVVVRDESIRFHVVETRGELDLRRKLSNEEEETSVYVVPFARQLPRDLESIFASGRLWWPQVEWLLPRRFGARTGTPRLLGSKLRRVAQRDGSKTYVRGDAPSVDLDDAWTIFLRDRLGVESLETEAQLLAATILERERRGKEVAALLDGVKGAREELVAVLERRMGPSAPRIVVAWLEDMAVEFAALAIVGEATRPVLTTGQNGSFALLSTVIEMKVLQTVGHPLRAVRDTAGAAGLAKALLELGYLVPLVWQKLEDSGNDALRRAILGEAEKLLASEQVRPLARASNRLPFVFEARCKTFVEALDAAVASAEGAIETVDRAASEVLAHEVAHGDRTLEEQVEMAARLAAFLAEP